MSVFGIGGKRIGELGSSCDLFDPCCDRFDWLADGRLACDDGMRISKTLFAPDLPDLPIALDNKSVPR